MALFRRLTGRASRAPLPVPERPADPAVPLAGWRPPYVGTRPPRKVAPPLSFDRRLAFCLGFLSRVDDGTFRVDGDRSGVIGRLGMEIATFHETCAHYPAGRRYLGGDRPERWYRRNFRTYVEPISNGMLRFGEGRPFLVQAGDNRRLFPVPVFTKSRLTGPGGFSVLLPLNRDWHFGPLEEVDANDIPFAHKEPRLVWRGKTTGVFLDRPGSAERGPRAHVLSRLAAGTDPAIDIGYSGLTPGLKAAGGDALCEIVSAGVKGAMSRAEQLRCRYLLALEGQDVASSLKWMLASNSVVLMPRPQVDSWACESLLEPFVHYVPVRPDLSDLDEAFAWCRANDDACRRISDNATAFMAPFRDAAAERALVDAVAERYFTAVTLVEGDDLPAGLL